jgi:NADH-quinone oxidoreductase subunit E
MATQEVNRILKRYNNDPSDIIAILQDVQRTYRYLPRDVLEYISGKMDVPLARIHHLSTFFRAFSLEPRGKHEIHVCMGTACHVRGAPRVLDAFERELKVAPGKTTPDGACTLETVNCVGACALGPVIILDEKSVGKMTPQKAERLLRQMNLAGVDAPRKKGTETAAPKQASAATKRRVRAAGKTGVKAGKKTTKKAR